MSAIATRSTKLSQVVAFEDMVDKGYCRETVTVTVQAGMDIGAALVRIPATGKYQWISQAALAATTPTQVIADGVAVLVDHEAGVNKLAAGDHQLAILVRGSAGITSASLTYADAVTAANKTATVAQFKKQGIVDRVQV